MVGETAGSLLSRESCMWNVTWLQLSLAATAGVEATAKLRVDAILMQPYETAPLWRFWNLTDSVAVLVEEKKIVS